MNGLKSYIIMMCKQKCKNTYEMNTLYTAHNYTITVKSIIWMKRLLALQLTYGLKIF